MTKKTENPADEAKTRLAAAGRNDSCPCGSGKKYKKCHLQADEAASIPPTAPPDPQDKLAAGWRLFEQRRPGAAEKEFRAALALAPDLLDARVGIGMSKLQAGDNDGARSELSAVIEASQGVAADLEKQGVKDAFTRKEAQGYIRAAHALGCLAYDQNRHEDSLADLERVYKVDSGPVGTEARLIAAKSLIKLGRAAEAVPLLEDASKGETGGSRADLGLALAQFGAGDRTAATAALERALAANPHYGKALLGLIRKRVDALAGTAPGSREEALVYAQTYGDVWDQPAKDFLEAVLNSGTKQRGASEEPAASPAG